MGFMLIAVGIGGFILYQGYKKTKGAESFETPSVKTPSGLQKLEGELFKLIGLAGAGVKVAGATSALIGGGTAAGTVGAAAVAPGAATILPGAGAAIPATGAGAVPVSGAASGFGTAAATAGLLAAPWILGPPLTSLLTGNKTLDDMLAEQTAYSKQLEENKLMLAREQKIAADVEAARANALTKLIALDPITNNTARQVGEQ